MSYEKALEYTDELLGEIRKMEAALEHALYQLPKDANQILGMRGALDRCQALLSKIDQSDTD